ncbi:mucin-13b isoform X2 [Labrus bergylta]|uniref:mucin-13b isoform X2 n=1 Tax=Labrus bergylta TaxID=56723 RepID=UPI003313E82B
MAPNFKPFSLIWLVAACLAPQATSAADGTTVPTAQEATAAPGDPSTAPKVTTAAPGDPSTAAKVTTAAPGDPSTTPKVTTAAPGDPSTAAKVTTAAPGDPSTAAKVTTAAPGDPSTAPKVTTAAPGDPSTAPKVTTAAPGDPSTAPKETTAAPGGPSTAPQKTTAAPGGPSTAPQKTTAGPGGPSATPQVTPDSPATKPPSTPAPTKPVPVPGPCESNPCGGGSTCVPRFNQMFECLCLPGRVHNNDSNTCESAKVFPGQLTLAKEYSPNLADPTSEDFLSVSKDVVTELDNVFKSTPGYSKSIVLKLKPAISVRVWFRATPGILAEVENIFEPTATIEAKTITETLKKAITESTEGSLLNGADFKEADLCTSKPCDVETTECTPKNGSFGCSCKDGYIKTSFSDRVCIACPSGKKAGTSGCVNCPFGYSGLNCNESWQLALVVVSVVVGGLLLISGIVMGVLACRPAKKSSKKMKDAGTAKHNVSNFSAKAPLVNSTANSRAPLVNGSANAYASAGVPRIPRAMTTSSLDHRTNLEMTPSSSRQNLVPNGRNARLYDDPDDMKPYTQARPQNNPYAQARPQNNPYAQNRLQNNPYSAKEGYTNPYVTNDNGRRLY